MGSIMVSAQTTAQPILRWAGSKRQILDELASYWGTGYERYIEPFCGSACLFLRIRPRKAILADLNSDLIATYLTIRSNPGQVAECLSRWDCDSSTYYKVRGFDSNRLELAERAARFIFLNRLCFNGLFRTNLQGQFNVPWGGLRGGRIPGLSQLEEFARALHGAEIKVSDFESTLHRAREGDFVYLDPPYRVSDRRVFREYLPTGFYAADVDRLRKSLERLHSLGVHFVLSYVDSDEGRSIAEGFQATAISVRRFISCKAPERIAIKELLITNCPAKAF